MSKRIRQRQRNRRAALVLTLLALGILGLLWLRGRDPAAAGGESLVPRTIELEAAMPEIREQLLTPNPYSRPQNEMEGIEGIVIHYTANPGSSAQENRDYFEGLKDSGATSASSHFIVGLEGEILQCVPVGEVAYASNDRNRNTLSIECCHPDASGQFTEATYRSLVTLTAWLCDNFQLSADTVIRHYDVTGKECPKYFVDHPEAWEQFRKDTAAQMETLETAAT